MSIKPVDLENMVKEMETLYKKYDVPKGMLFIPDKLAIVIERKDVDEFDLTYSEFFNYLPSSVLYVAMQYATRFLQQMGIPSKSITKLENGVRFEISGDFHVISAPILELLFQKKIDESEIRAIFDMAIKTYNTLNILGDYYWSWNEEIRDKWNKVLNTLSEITQKHPSFLNELESVMKKYTSG